MEKAEFGAFVAQNRKKLALTQKDLAEQLHVTDKAVSKWERGLSYPDVTLLEPLAEVFGLGVTELMACGRSQGSPAPADPADRELPPQEEESPGEEAVQALLDISGEGLRMERRRRRRTAALLGVLALLLGAALLVVGILSGMRRTTETGRIRVLHTEGTGGGLVLYTEKEGHILSLSCAPELDTDALLELIADGDAFPAEYRWDRRNWTGTLMSFRREGAGAALGGPMDEIGSVLVLYDGDGELLGFSRVVERVLDRQPNPYGAGFLSTYQFYRMDEDGRWEDGEFLRAENCLGFSRYGDGGWRIADTDGDGTNELLVRTVWPEKPCIVFDLEEGRITETWLDEMPEELSGPVE